MSAIAIQSSGSGAGTLTIAAPITATNRTLTLPDSTGTLATAESTLTQFSASGSAPVYAARAWVNFNGTGTVAIRGSGNVSSITDNGTGDYTVNFTTAMPNANYAVALGSTQLNNANSDMGFLIRGTTAAGATTKTTTTLRVISASIALFTATDSAELSVTIVG